MAMREHHPRPISLRWMALLVLITALAAGSARAAPAGGTTSGDYQNDLRRAADLRREQVAATERWVRQGRPSNTGYEEAQQPRVVEIRRILNKWETAGKGTEFYNDYLALLGEKPEPGGQGTTPADYQRDVERAGQLMREKDQADRRWWAEGRPNPRAHGQAEQAFNRQIRALLDKWKAAGLGTQFYNDYTRAYRSGGFASRPPSAAPGGTPPQDATAADYQSDVRRAADLIRQKDAAERRWFWQKPKPEESSPTPNPIGVELRRLNEKWTAAGKGAQFYADYLRLARPPQKPLAERLAPAIILALLAFVYLLYRLFRGRAPVRPARSTTYGSARFASVETEIRDPDCLAKGIFLGKSSHPELAGAALNSPGAPVCSTPERHTLIVGQTRTGKGTRIIVPTLLRYQGSALVIDPKGENAAITARARQEQLGQDIHIINPWNMLPNTFGNLGFTPATYNPLDVLDLHDPNAVAVAQSLARAICPISSGGNEKFWEGSAASLLAAVFLWLAWDPGEKKTLARTRQIVTLTRAKLTRDFLIPMAASKGFDGAISELAQPFVDMPDVTYGGVVTNLTTPTDFLSDQQVKAATSTSSFPMMDLATGQATVYVVFPFGEMDTKKTWLRLVIASAMQAFKKVATPREDDHRCLFLIDEFGSMGRLDDVPRDIATMSGFGVDFALIIQNLGQLKEHYGEGSKGTILSNCGYKLFCNVGDPDAKYVSDILGRTTVETMSTSDSQSDAARGAGGSHTVSKGETGRPLLMPDEVRKLGRDVAIVFQPEGDPLYLRTIDFWDLPEAFSSLKEKQPQLYWEPSLMYDDNPYHRRSGRNKEQGNRQRQEEQKQRQQRDQDQKQKQKQQPPPPREEPMTRKRAMEVLELDGDASPEAIQKAYLRLTKMVHPDMHGGRGSNYFQKELNAARDFLLRP